MMFRLNFFFSQVRLRALPLLTTSNLDSVPQKRTPKMNLTLLLQLRNRIRLFRLRCWTERNLSSFYGQKFLFQWMSLEILHSKRAQQMLFVSLRFQDRFQYLSSRTKQKESYCDFCRRKPLVWEVAVSSDLG